jgi:NAD(P)-dependent dehydrogenase (short-subunit alcohol dehydrogenase family)
VGSSAPREEAAGDLFDLTGRVAIITGATRGLGRAMAEAFASRGSHLVVASRKADVCEEVARELSDRYGVSALAAPTNVSEWQQCDRLVEQTYARFGHVDVLVNNAGISPLYPSPEEVTEALFDKVLAVNLKGPFRLTALVGARMAAGIGGSIINVSSLAAIRPTPDVLPYAAAKAALNNLTEGFARSLGPKVRVNAIMAGRFLTDIARAWDPAVLAEATQLMALRRAGAPDEVIGAALYFASAASSYCTGAVLRLDGGAP